ncbi:hypothetical protein [Mesorhizobium sp.]|uniref:hypothetical protein n=1 Tax=Mesorhizobium sp. TaxID=1871066 RepID=UPI000FE89EC8|nr:hypothetical protein [Mesorhizobium sp.]RWG07544.1 MAG: hypothetical protein EOQ54_04050 [Mesorhizobium sp.]RWG93651.1 MAG: hypothetical protein EOQ72_29750 [Mesorhizobium sp.]
MLLPEFVPDHWKTPKTEAAVEWLQDRVRTGGDKEDVELLIKVALSFVEEVMANADATPREEVDRIIGGHLARWHERFGLTYDAFADGDDHKADDVRLDDDVLAFPLPDVFTLEGFPAPLFGDALEARDFMPEFREMARAAWEARR